MDSVRKWIMKVLGFSRLIKIPGKSEFDQLTQREIGSMIDAFLGDGNEQFDQLAFNEFLHATLRDPSLKKLRDELNANAFLPAEGNQWPAPNYDYLRSLADELQARTKRR